MKFSIGQKVKIMVLEGDVVRTYEGEVVNKNHNQYFDKNYYYVKIPFMESQWYEEEMLSEGS